MIRPYLSDMINNHKAHGKSKVHSGNKVIDYETPGEWKTQLTMKINFVSSKNDSHEIRTMRTKSDNVHILMVSKTDEITEELFESFCKTIKRI